MEMPQFDLKGLAQRVHLLRAERRWSQGDLAEAAGLTQSQVSQLENMKFVNPPINVLWAVAEATGVSKEYIMLLTDDPHANVRDLKDQSLPPADALLLERINRLNDRERYIVESLVETILSEPPLSQRRGEPRGRNES
jgi:transcriptional regulator with XRE-family HTH domain